MEARSFQPLAGSFLTGCLASFSNLGGNLSAIGEGVFTLYGPAGPEKKVDGTSFSSPQAAGLAAYLFAIDPRLGVQELKALLLGTARPVEQCSGAPVIDAYSAVLGVDEGVDAPGDAPVRMAILDVADATGSPGTNDEFDEHDVALYLDEFEARAGDFDYSRYDLNGNGSTGDQGVSIGQERVDLDGSRIITEGLKKSLHGTQVTFNESVVTDLEVLCYYAYSGLFNQDDEFERADQLALRCGAKPEIVVEGVPTSVPPDLARFPLTVKVQVPADDGTPIALRDAELSLDITGAFLRFSDGREVAGDHIEARTSEGGASASTCVPQHSRSRSTSASPTRETRMLRRWRRRR